MERFLSPPRCALVRLPLRHDCALAILYFNVREEYHPLKPCFNALQQRLAAAKSGLICMSSMMLVSSLGAATCTTELDGWLGSFADLAKSRGVYLSTVIQSMMMVVVVAVSNLQALRLNASGLRISKGRW